MTVPHPARLEELAIMACRVGGDQVAPALGAARSLGVKSSPTDVVTETDVASERAILDFLELEMPDAAYLAEESGSDRGARVGRARVQWIVDPLDGTVNFLYGLGAVAISVAAAVDGRLVAGAVLDVTRNEVFSASLGNGARIDGSTMAVTSCGDLSQAMVASGYSYDGPKRAAHGAVVADLLHLVRDIRCFGSSALHLSWVAAGRLDAYFERDTKPWDWAAGTLIAAEAGAVVESPCAENADLVMAAAPGIFGELRELVDQRIDPAAVPMAGNRSVGPGGGAPRS